MKIKICICTIISILLLTACSPGAAAQPTGTAIDMNAVATSIAGTVIANITEQAAEFTPTLEPTATTALTSTPTITLTPGITETPTEKICDDMVFLSDVTIPDNTVEAPGAEFVKTWKVKNIAACTWTTGYRIINAAYGDKMGGETTALTAEVLPDAEAEISMTLKAPTTPGKYSSFWRLSNNNGYTFGTVLTVVIVVQ